MTRFSYNKGASYITKYIFAICIFFAVIFAFAHLIDAFSQSADENGKKSLEAALKRNITYCYATEGAYPESLDYIIDNYGLIYDKEKYFIDYRVIGANIYPSISIIEIRKE